MAILIVLGAIVLLALYAYFASLFKEIASEKGYDDSEYFWLPFLFPIVGYPLVAALPDKHARTNTAAIVSVIENKTSSHKEDDELPVL